MNFGVVACPNCKTPLPNSACNTADLVRCPSCEDRIQVEVFPALFKPIAQGRSAEIILVEGESSCFYHAQKKAVMPCDVCGRFLCALCDVEINDQHVCPACLETGRKKGQLANLEKGRTLYDSAALSLAVLPLVIFPFTLLTAPLAIFFAVLSWFRPSSIVPRTRLRSYVAIIVALAQLAFWIAAFTGKLRMFD